MGDDEGVTPELPSLAPEPQNFFLCFGTQVVLCGTDIDNAELVGFHIDPADNPPVAKRASRSGMNVNSPSDMEMTASIESIPLAARIAVGYMPGRYSSMIGSVSARPRSARWRR